MLMLIDADADVVAVFPLAERLYSPKKDLAPCWFRSCSAPKIKSLGRLTTFLSAAVVAQHVRNLGPGCVLKDIGRWVFFPLSSTRRNGRACEPETVADMPRVPDARACLA